MSVFCRHKHPFPVAKNTALDVPISHRKNPVLLPRTQLEMYWFLGKNNVFGCKLSRGLTKNICFRRHKRGWRLFRLLINIIWFALSQTDVLFKTELEIVPWFPEKYPVVSRLHYNTVVPCQKYELWSLVAFLSVTAPPSPPPPDKKVRS